MEQLRHAAAMMASAPSAAVASAQEEEVPGFILSWETIVVATEIVAALGTSLFLLYRKAESDRNLPAVSSFTCSNSSSQPRGFCSLDALLYFRVVALAFYVVVQLYDLYRTRLLCLIFYTSWNFIAQGVYFGIAVARTLQTRKLQQGSRRGYAPLFDEGTSSTATAVSRHPHRGWIRLELALDVCLATSILISVVVWTILYPYAVKMHYPEKILNWVSYCQHALNLVFLQVDFLSTRHTVSFHALPLLIAWPSVYSVFTWLLHGTIAKGFWPYPFMEVNTPYAPLWYAGLLLAHGVGFAIVYAISRCKSSGDDIATSSNELEAAGH
ncbi:Threonine-trna ligase [Globisporangium polare]